MRLSGREHRMAFRVKPDPKLKIRVADREAIITDLSATGVSFCHDGLSQGEQHAISFTLPGCEHEIRATVEIVSVRESSLCGSCFLDLGMEEEEMLHGFILEQQKRQIRAAACKTEDEE